MAGSSSVETLQLHVPVAYGDPPSGWSWSRLDGISEGVFDCPHSTPKLTETGPFVVRTQDIITGVFRPDQAAHVSSETYAERIARVTPSRGDLLYSREGTYFGIAAEVPEDSQICLGQRMVLIRPDRRRLDFRFLRHWLNSPVMAAYINGFRDGSVAERLNLPTIRGLPVLVPPLANQKAIAAVLGALDDKIELNRRMNATLEAMARALFQSWFVDFDPVRAKLDGRKPDGLDKTTAALFPAALQDSALGRIPHGWEVKRIEDVVEGVYDGPHATPPTSDSGPIFLGIGNLTGTALDLSDIRHINEDEWARWTKRVTPKAGDIVFSYEATLDFFALIPPNIRCCLGRRLALIRPLEHEGFPHFWFHQFISLPFQQFLDQHTIQGATVNRIPLIAFPSYPVLNPPSELKVVYEQYAEPLWLRIHAHQAQSRTLAAVRDTLLPKLLSGALNVS